MHEMSMAMQLLDIVHQTVVEYGFQRVDRIVVQQGEFVALNEDAFRFSFTHLIKDSCFDNSELIIKRIPASAYCSHCRTSYPVDFIHRQCPTCNGYGTDLVTGYELLVERIEGE